MSMATVASIAASAYSINQQYEHGDDAAGAAGGADPFGRFRGQFGDQLAGMFANGQTPSWLTPGQGMNFGAGLKPGQGMADPSMLNFDPASIVNDPAYQFQKRQGLDAISAQAAAAGELDSGGAMAGAAKFGQGLATDFTNQQLQRNLSRYQAINAGQNQDFGQVLAGMGFQNQAQGQQFGQGNQLTSLLAMLSGATQTPAAGTAAATGANVNAYGQQQQGFGNIMSSLGMLGRAFGSSGSGGSGGLTSGSGASVWSGGGW